MSLRINQNIGAMNVHRNLTAADNSVGKSIERLSSGYRINRASDDPAGLIISETLRAQVDGLGQAVSNSNDAINLVKTAEGALTEVNSLLRSMRDLAVHASNVGANNAEAAAADQVQIKSAIESLNRISEMTQFNGKCLLNGNAGVTGTSTNAKVSVLDGLSTVQAGAYDVDITTAATQASVSTTNVRQVIQTTGTSVAAASTSAAGSTLTFSGALLGNAGDSYVLNVATGDTLDTVAAKINSDEFMKDKVSASVVDDTATPGNKMLVINSKALDTVAGDLTVVGTDAALGTDAMTATAAVTATADAGLSAAETLTMTDNVSGKSTAVSLLAGDSLQSVMDKINTAASNGGVRVQASFDEGKIVFKNTAYGSTANASVSITSTAAAATTTNMGIGAGTLLVSSAGAAVVGEYAAATGGTDVAGTIGGEAGTGAGQILTGNGLNTDGLRLTVGLDAADLGAGPEASVNVSQGALVFQIGSNHGQTVSQSISSTAADKLGSAATGLATSAKSVADIDITSLDGAQDAIKLIDAAISQVSTQRGQMGAFQSNILESNINSLGIAKENLAASESTIRDTDMASEMTTFTRNQIMVQAGTAMLAQANQLPQQLLRLLQ